jgi:ATP-dependent RNA helicase DHX57
MEEGKEGGLRRKEEGGRRREEEGGRRSGPNTRKIIHKQSLKGKASTSDLPIGTVGLRIVWRMREEEGRGRKDGGGRRKEEGGRRKDGGGRRKEEGGRRKEKERVSHWREEGGRGE